MSHRRIKNAKGAKSSHHVTFFLYYSLSGDAPDPGRASLLNPLEGRDPRPFPTQRTDWPDEDRGKESGKAKPTMTDVAPSGSNTGDRFYNPSFRPIFPGGEDTGIPAHMGSVKKLHSKTGYNLAVSLVDDKYKVIGTTDGNADGDDVLQLSSEEVGEVRIFGMKSRHYVAMDEDGKVYAEADNSAEATIFFEDLYNGWTIYRSKLNADKGWYLGIKKSAKAKRGHRTALGQNATLFIPRPTEQ